MFADLDGKVALVTGGSRGIGAQTCRELARCGARVAVGGRDEAAVDQVVRDIETAGGEAVAAVADCTDATALAQTRDEVEARLGQIEILAAFAGAGRRPKPVTDIPDEEWRQDIEQNLTATFLTVKCFLPGMLERGRGSVITMASAAARPAGGSPVAYAAAKAGVIALSQQLAHQVGPQGVRVNCLSPSTILTEENQGRIPDEVLAQKYPLGRLGAPEDVANAALFLASDASSWITGVTLDIAGGHVQV